MDLDTAIPFRLYGDGCEAMRTLDQENCLRGF